MVFCWKQPDSFHKIILLPSLRGRGWGWGFVGLLLFFALLVTLNNLASSAIELYRAIEQYCYYGYHWIE